MEIPFGTPLGLNFKSVIHTESRYLDFGYLMQVAKMYNYNPMNMIRFMFAPHSVNSQGYPSHHFHEYRMQYDPVSSQTKEVEMIFSVGAAVKKRNEAPKYYNIRVKNLDELRSGNNLVKKLMPYELVSRPIDEQVHPQRQQTLKNVIEMLGLRSGAGMTFQLSTILHGSRPRTFTYKMTLGGGNNHSMKQKWHVVLESEPQSHSMAQKICVDGSAEIPSVPYWDIERIQATLKDATFKNVIGFGRTCEESMIKMFGNTKFSQKQQSLSRKSPVAQECQQLINRQVPGAHSSKVCEETRLLAKMVDEIDLKIEYINTPVFVKYGEMKLTEALKAFLWPYLRENVNYGPNMARIGENREVLVRVVFDKSINAFNLVINKPEETVTFKNVRIPAPYNIFFPIVLGQSNTLLSLETITGHAISPKCQIEKSWLRTYDGRSLPIHLDDCFHFVTGDCSAQYSFGVLARAFKHSQTKELKIFLKNNEIKLSPSESYSTYLRDIMVIVNGNVIPMEKNQMKSIFDKSSEMEICKIYRSKDGVMHLMAPAYNLDLQFDGERLAVSSSQLLKNKLCGICGNFNHQSSADLAGPKKCIYSKPEVEIASYRISDPHCSPLQGSIKEKLATETKNCAKYHEIPTEVYKTFIASVGQCSRTEHMVLERSEEVCISRLPVLQCGAQCTPKPRQLVSKKVSFTCMKRGRIAELYREKAIQGLELPELKNKHESFATSILVPQSCVSVISGRATASNSGINSSVPNGSAGSPSGNSLNSPRSNGQGQF